MRPLSLSTFAALLALTALVVPAAGQDTRVQTRVIVKGDASTAVMVDEDGNAEVVPFGKGHGWSWVGRGDGEHGKHLRYLNLGHSRRFIGVQLMRLTPELRDHFGVEGEAGVMVSKVFEDSPAQRAGVEVGDIITTAGGVDVASPGDLSQVIADSEEGEDVEIALVREGRPQSLRVAVKERERRLMNVTPGLIEGRWPLVIGEDKNADVSDILERLGKYFQSDEWETRVEHLEGTDWAEVEERMKAVERRLKELEGALDQADR